MLTEDIFRPLANMLGENLERPLVALATIKEKMGKVVFLAENAKRDIEAIDKAATNEDLFNAQNRLHCPLLVLPITELWHLLLLLCFGVT